MFNFIALLVVIIGSLNWFAIGVFQFDLIAGIFGTQSAFFSRFLYTLVGLAGFWTLFITLVKGGKVVYYTKKTKKSKDNHINNPENLQTDIKDLQTDFKNDEVNVDVDSYTKTTLLKTEQPSELSQCEIIKKNKTINKRKNN